MTVILARSATSTTTLSTTAATATVGASSAVFSRLGAVVCATGGAVAESYCRDTEVSLLGAKKKVTVLAAIWLGKAQGASIARKWGIVRTSLVTTGSATRGGVRWGGWGLAGGGALVGASRSPVDDLHRWLRLLVGVLIVSVS